MTHAQFVEHMNERLAVVMLLCAALITGMVIELTQPSTCTTDTECAELCEDDDCDGGPALLPRPEVLRYVI